ncbi:MAG TPA: PP2C family protein-serine/threonine phosphatase [Candidatus Eisenbacteria bacterium]|nr:PP2C family protein-serine/threonine phosphatase [Candidatus Eisenbacteria bacterium]
MATIETGYLQTAREQLQSRRERLENVLHEHPTEQLSQLLTEVDQALERIDTGHYGECAVCHGTVETDRLLHDPLVSVCLECLSPTQQRALEYDLELAARIQNGLLPAPDVSIPGWQVAYHYRPAGVIGGDYCDVISDGRGGAYFLIADVAGKGVAAAMLTANLRAVFRALVPLGMPVEELLAHANRLFCEGKLPMQYATLVFGYSSPAGELKLVNAGHLPAFLVHGSGVDQMESGGLPLGLFCEQQFIAESAELVPGDMLVLFTDGVSEAQDARGEEYGVGKLLTLIEEGKFSCPEKVIEACRDCLQDFRGDTPRADDETLLAIQFVGTGARMVV